MSQHSTVPSPQLGEPPSEPNGQATHVAAHQGPAPATQLSRNAFFADFYVYPAVSGLFIICSLASEPSKWLRLLSTVGAGVAAWSLTEYLLHRYVLHHVAWVKRQHDVHHEDQKALVGTPSWFSMLVFIAFVAVPTLLLTSVEIAACFTSGMMLGYLCYVTAHYGMHHWRISASGHLGRLRCRHALHHHFDDLGNFGVTTGFWDHVFRTNIEP